MPIYIVENTRDIILSLAALAIALASLWRLWGRPAQRWFRDLARVIRENLAINGDEHLLPEELRGLGTRSLLIRHIAAYTSAREEALAAPIVADLEAHALLARAVVVAQALLEKAALTAGGPTGEPLDVLAEKKRLRG